jgi:hypothetical protein
MRIDVGILSRAVTEIVFRGCVPRLPAPGCWPERGERVPRPCFPALDTLSSGRAAAPRIETPRSNRGTGARRR